MVPCGVVWSGRLGVVVIYFGAQTSGTPHHTITHLSYQTTSGIPYIIYLYHVISNYGNTLANLQ